jgi:hypothetical protein
MSFGAKCEPPNMSSIICGICKSPLSCIAVFAARIFYILGKDHITSACAHLSVYGHPVKNGEYHNFKDQTYTPLGEQVKRTPDARNSYIAKEVTMELMGELLLHSARGPQKTFNLEELLPVLDKCKYMSLLSIRNKVTSFKYLRKFGVMGSITIVRGCSN